MLHSKQEAHGQHHLPRLWFQTINRLEQSCVYTSSQYHGLKEDKRSLITTKKDMGLTVKAPPKILILVKIGPPPIYQEGFFEKSHAICESPIRGRLTFEMIRNSLTVQLFFISGVRAKIPHYSIHVHEHAIGLENQAKSLILQPFLRLN